MVNPPDSDDEVLLELKHLFGQSLCFCEADDLCFFCEVQCECEEGEICYLCSFDA